MSISIPGVSLRDGGAVIPQGPNVSGSLNPAKSVTGPKPIPLFRDFGKNVNDAFTKNFPANYKVELTTAQDNGLRFVIFAEKRHDATTNVDSMFVSSQVKFDKSGANFVGTIDSEKLEGEIGFNNLGLTGLKTVFKGKFLDNNRTEASAELQYISSPVSGAAGLFIKDNKFRTEAQVSADVYPGVTVGALASYFLPSGVQEGYLDNYQLGGSYTTGRITLTEILKASRNPKAGNELTYGVGSRVYYNHDASNRFAADVTYSLGKSFKEVEVKLFGERNFDKNTLGRVAVERSGKVRLAVRHQLNENFSLTVSADVNALRVEEHNVGITASFTA